jgi:hypothetical protein
MTPLLLMLDLLTLPFLVGAATVGLSFALGRLSSRPWRAALITGIVCALVHAIGVLSLAWKDGDWVGYLVMLCVTALMAAALYKK